MSEDKTTENTSFEGLKSDIGSLAEALQRSATASYRYAKADLKRRGVSDQVEQIGEELQEVVTDVAQELHQKGEEVYAKAQEGFDTAKETVRSKAQETVVKIATAVIFGGPKKPGM